MKTLFCLLFLLTGLSTYASDLSEKFGVGLAAGYPIPSFGNNFNDAADPKNAVGIHGRYHFTSKLGVEFGYLHSKFKDFDAQFDSGNLLGLYRFNGESDFSFVGGAGLGLTKIKNYVPSSLKLSLLARLGIEYNLTSNLILGGHVDYQYVSKLVSKMPTGRDHVIMPSLALTWYFGGDEKKEEAKEKIEEVKEQVKEQIKEVLKVDSDKDGVIDTEDKCPNTKEGEKVNDFGCALSEKAQIKINVEFLSGKSDVRPEYQSHLQEVADFLKKHETVKVQIEGYTDNAGSVKANTKKKKKRATAVMNELVKLGVAKDRMTAKGFGPNNPIADNSTLEGKQKNRRVIAVIEQ